MLLRSKLVRSKPGSNPPEPIPSFVVEFGEKRERRYEFKLDEVGDHVCDVKHKEDCAKLLAISEGYEIHPSLVEKVEQQSDADAKAKEKAEAEAKAKAEAEAKAQAEADAKAKAEADAAAKGDKKDHKK